MALAAIVVVAAVFTAIVTQAADARTSQTSSQFSFSLNGNSQNVNSQNAGHHISSNTIGIQHNTRSDGGGGCGRNC